MQVLQIHPAYADVQLMADECVVLAQVCEVALEDHFQGREEAERKRYVETAGGLFRAVAVAGLARHCMRPAEQVELDGALAEAGL